MKLRSSFDGMFSRFFPLLLILIALTCISVVADGQSTTPSKTTPVVPTHSGIGGASGAGMGSANGRGVGTANGRGVGQAGGNGVSNGSGGTVSTTGGNGTGRRTMLLLNPSIKGRAASAVRNGGTGGATGTGVGSSSGNQTGTAAGNGTGTATGEGVGTSESAPASTTPDLKTYIKEMNGTCYYVTNEGAKVLVPAKKCEIN